jgi:hypothetical protein
MKKGANYITHICLVNFIYFGLYVCLNIQKWILVLSGFFLLFFIQEQVSLFLLAKAAGDENNPQLDQQNMEKQKLNKKL